MPIYEFGYRQWSGALRPRMLRWWPITRNGVRLALRSAHLRRLLLLAWAPLFYFGPLFFALGTITESPPQSSSATYQIARSVLGEQFLERLQDDPLALRPVAWNCAFFVFLGSTQSLLLLFVVAIVAPPLISHDVRGKSFLLYFSKSIKPWEYVLGKAGVLFWYVAMVTLLPALALYAVSIAFAPTFSVLADTSDTIWRIIAASLGVAVPTTALALFYSSMTQEPRFATFAWAVTCLLGEALYWGLKLFPATAHAGWTFVLSIRQCSLILIVAVFDIKDQLKAFDLEQANELFRATRQSTTGAVAVLACITIVATLGLLRQITAPVRI